MSTWTAVRLVAWREVDEKLHSRAFLLSTLLFLGIVVVTIALPPLLFDDGPPEYEVAVVGARAEALVESVPGESVVLSARAVPDAAEADRLLREERVDAALEVSGDGLLVRGLAEVPDDLVSALTASAQLARLSTALAESGAAPGDVGRLLSPVPVQERVLDDTGAAPEVVLLLSMAFALLFFFVVYQFGYAIAQGVVQEKESRIVEILVSAVPVRALLYGKVLGNGGLALAQIVLLVLVAVTGAALTGETELLSLLVRNAGWFVLFFALGFAMLSCLWAAAGALAARTEDLQSTSAPLQVLVVAAFLTSVYVPGGTARTVLSFVPLSSPLVMPARLVEGDAQAWEAVLSALLLLATAVLAVRVGARLYRASLLRTRGRTTLSQALAEPLPGRPAARPAGAGAAGSVRS